MPLVLSRAPPPAGGVAHEKAASVLPTDGGPTILALPPGFSPDPISV